MSEKQVKARDISGYVNRDVAIFIKRGRAFERVTGTASMGTVRVLTVCVYTRFANIWMDGDDVVTVRVEDGA